LTKCNEIATSEKDKKFDARTKLTMERNYADKCDLSQRPFYQVRHGESVL